MADAPRSIAIIAGGKHHDNAEIVGDIMKSVIREHGADAVWYVDLCKLIPNPAGGKKEPVFQKTDSTHESTVLGVFANAKFANVSVQLIRDIVEHKDIYSRSRKPDTSLHTLNISR